MTIPFNKPYLTGKETHYIYQAVAACKLSGDGAFSKKCQSWLQQRYGFHKTLLTTSCTDALEMAAILLEIKSGDEVVMPSYTFVSTANAFVLRGAEIVFADSEASNPNVDADQIEQLITERTKAIVVVHYAGVACDMDKILAVAQKNNIPVIEDAAQAIDSYYKGKALGSLGSLAAFSFHETKNIISGEGGALVINDPKLVQRAEIIREKGTNRSAFFRGEVDKYNWVDIGSSFLPSELIGAFLYAQLEELEEIQERRISIWNRYYQGLKGLEEQGKLQLPVIPEYATNNAHMFYVVCNNGGHREGLINYLKERNINAVFHYLSLHKSPFYLKDHEEKTLHNCERYADCLVRLPFFYELVPEMQDRVIEAVNEFYKKEPV